MVVSSSICKSYTDSAKSEALGFCEGSVKARTGPYSIIPDTENQGYLQLFRTQGTKTSV